MAKVEFEDPIASLTGILVASDPYYFRRYPKSGGGRDAYSAEPSEPLGSYSESGGISSTHPIWAGVWSRETFGISGAREQESINN